MFPFIKTERKMYAERVLSKAEYGQIKKTILMKGCCEFVFTRTVSAILACKLSSLIGRRGEVSCLSVEIPCSFFIERTTRKLSLHGLPSRLHISRAMAYSVDFYVGPFQRGWQAEISWFVHASCLFSSEATTEVFFFFSFSVINI